jgi:hypothetical protein
MPKTTFTATLPDGEQITRSTDASRHPYRYVVICRSDGIDGMRPGWGYLTWTTRLDLAQKAVNQYRGWEAKGADLHDIQIVEVENPIA